MHQLQGNKEYGSEKKGYLLKKSDGYVPGAFLSLPWPWQPEGFFLPLTQESARWCSRGQSEIEPASSGEAAVVLRSLTGA